MATLSLHRVRAPSSRVLNGYASSGALFEIPLTCSTLGKRFDGGYMFDNPRIGKRGTTGIIKGPVITRPEARHGCSLLAPPPKWPKMVVVLLMFPQNKAKEWGTNSKHAPQVDPKKGSYPWPLRKDVWLPTKSGSQTWQTACVQLVSHERRMHKPITWQIASVV